MPKLPDLTGRTFGRLTVKELGPSHPRGGRQWWCECSCGNPERVLVFGSYLLRGHRLACGCLKPGPDGPTRFVRDPDGVVYDSLRAAADCFGMSPRDVRRWCRNGDYGWSFDTD